MSKTIKTITTLKKHVGDTVQVTSYDGYTFDAEIVDNLRGSCLGLFTKDKAAEKDSYWWWNGEGYAHVIVKSYQLKEELKSITLVKAKVKKTAKTFVSAEDLKANVGHYCEMADGSTGLIAGSVHLGNVCVLHNSKGSEGWTISKFTRKEEIKGVQKSLIKKFSRGWHVSEDYEAKQVKVVKILDEVVKCKKAKRRKVTFKDLEKNIGHGCTFKSGDKGYISKSTSGCRFLVCFNTKQNGHGWLVDRDVPDYLHKHFKYAYFVSCDMHLKDLKISSIDTETTDFQVDESKKSFLTRKQLLENIGKHCKMSDGTEGFIVKTNLKNPRILMSSTVNGLGWSYNGYSDDTGAPSSVKSKYKCAWNVCDDDDAENISVVEILDDEKSTEPSKTLLDMTVREVLEKLNEIIISR